MIRTLLGREPAYFIKLLLVSGLLIQSAQLDAQQSKSWQFPWSKSYLPIKIEKDEEIIDGRLVSSAEWVGKNLKLGGPIGGPWTARSSKSSSLSLQMAFGVGASSEVFLYSPGNFVPPNNKEQFQAFAEGIAKQALLQKQFKVSFNKSESGLVKIRPDSIKNRRRLILEMSSGNETKGFPLLIQSPYYQLLYEYTQEGEIIKGAALFIYRPGAVLCVSFEEQSENFERRFGLLKDYLNDHFFIVPKGLSAPSTQ